ncbi:hypothetical protein BDR06DRAFT_1009156 [Suillus hirtellus]|nr:hypothetical protein BDR06DRAFT_1009156 [Suillus hirtellus]
MAICALDYANDEDSDSKLIKICFLGVASSTSYTSETQVKAWKETISNISAVFNDSPLAHSSHLALNLAGFLCRLKGMDGNHTSDVKKTQHLIEQWKYESIYMSLGYEAMIEMSSADLKQLLDHAERLKVVELDGHDSWVLLSTEDQKQHWSQIMEALTLWLGTECFNKLPVDTQ